MKKNKLNQMKKLKKRKIKQKKLLKLHKKWFEKQNGILQLEHIFYWTPIHKIVKNTHQVLLNKKQKLMNKIFQIYQNNFYTPLIIKSLTKVLKKEK
jgi:hypothetical protein